MHNKYCEYFKKTTYLPMYKSGTLLFNIHAKSDQLSHRASERNILR